MGDRVAVLKDGRLQQCDTPRRMYDHPDNVFVAGFIGSPAMNLLDVAITDQGVQFGQSYLPVDRDALSQASTDTLVVGVRPEDVDLAPPGTGLDVEVDVVEELGADAYVYGRRRGAEATDRPFIARVDGRRPPMKGEVVGFVPKTEHVHLFDVQTGERLGD